MVHLEDTALTSFAVVRSRWFECVAVLTLCCLVILLVEILVELVLLVVV